MLKQNDLRIGNLFWDSYGGYYKVTALNCNKVGRSDKIFTAVHIRGGAEGAFEYEHAQPIELTPEILEKCGFEVTSKGFFTYPNWYNLSLKYARGTYNLRCNFMDIIANNIDYLHQLQNLTYALTQTELNITL